MLNVMESKNIHWNRQICAKLSQSFSFSPLPFYLTSSALLICKIAHKSGALYNAAIASYAALGLKLESKSSGLELALHESLSLTPQTVIPTHFSMFRQALAT